MSSAGESADGSTGAWVAVDGGQSAVRVRLGTTGREASGPGVRHRPGGTGAGMLDSIRQALADLGDPRVDVAVLGMSGLPSDPPQLRRLRDGIIDATAAHRVLLTGDHVTCHAGALTGEPGVVATVGTGVAVLGLTPAGRLNRVDGRGYLLGDDGSAFQLGSLGLRAVLGHAEGLNPPTALTDAAVARYGPVAQIAPSLYRSETPVDRIARFAEDVVATARAGDPTASGLVRDAMRQVARSVAAAARGFDGSPVPVVVVGGLMRAADVVVPLLEQALAETLPSARLRPPAGAPLDGAAWLAAFGPGPYASETHMHDLTSGRSGADPFHDRGDR
jgi:N-acetylglucosamine kinase-like BadF-type ATPase